MHLFVFLQPLESKLISDTSGLFEANHVARIILCDAVVSEKFLQSLCSIVYLLYSDGVGNLAGENCSVSSLI